MARGLRACARRSSSPLSGSEGTLGLLVVADRLGRVRTFDDDDVLLLETVANHAGVALRTAS